MKNKRLIGSILIFAAVFLVTLTVPIAARSDPATDEIFFKNLPNSVAWVVVGDYSGTGFVVTEDGLMLTAAHVVGDKLMVDVIFNPNDETKKEKRSAQVIVSDYFTDVAVLKIISKNNEKFYPLSFGNPQELVSGYSDISIAGYPPSIGGKALYIGSGKITQKDILLTQNINVGFGPYIATNIIGGKGNSGGPCIYKNKVIGIAGFQIIVNSRSDETGLSMCISLISASQILEKAIEGKPVIRGRLDVTLGQFDSALTKELDQYKESSPEKLLSTLFIINPHKSGLRPLDRIISIAFQNDSGEYTLVPISTATDFKRTLGNLRPGTFITVTIVRAGEEMALRLLVEPLFQGNVSSE